MSFFDILTTKYFDYTGQLTEPDSHDDMDNLDGISSTEKRQRVLEAALQKNMLICEALWELLREKTNLTEQDLYAKIHEVDMRDGVLDGKNSRKSVDCPDCGKKVSSRHPLCIYCGRVIDTSVFNLE